MKVAFPETASNRFISFWLSGRALVSGQAERSNHRVSAFSLLFFSLLYVSSISPFLLFCFFFQLSCCTAIVVVLTVVVHTWWVRGLFLDGFFCCVLCFTAVQRTSSTDVVQGGCVGGWIGSWVCPCVRRGRGCSVFFPAIPAPRWHSSAYWYTGTTK